MSDDEIVIEVKGRDVGLTQLLAQTEAALRRTDQAGGRLGENLGRASSVPRSGFLALQQSIARNEAATGNYTAAIARLEGTLRQQNATTTQTLAAERQLISLRAQAAAAAAQEASANAQLAGSTSTLASGLGAIKGALGAAGLAVGVGALAQGSIELVKLGATAGQTSQKFNQLAQAAGQSGVELLRALQAASGGTVADTNLQLAAMRANLLGVGSSAAQLAPLMEIARDRAQAMGITTAQAFDDLITGLGRGSALILDNLGITVKIGEANEQYAASLGKTAAQLSEAEKKQALINAVVAQGKATLEATGGAAETQAAKIERFVASWQNLQAQLGQAIAPVATGALEGATQLLTLGDRVNQLNGQILAGATTWQQYTGQVQMANQSLSQVTPVSVALGLGVQQLGQAQFAYAQQLIATGTASDQAFAAAQRLGSTQTALNTAIQATANSAPAVSAALQGMGADILAAAGSSSAAQVQIGALLAQVTAAPGAFGSLAVAVNQVAAAQDLAANSAALLAQRHGEQTAGALQAADGLAQLGASLTEEDAAQQINAVNAQALSVEKERLAQTAQAAAAAIVAGGGNIQATAAKLANSASLVDQLTAAYLRLAAAQSAASGIGAAVVEPRLERQTRAESDALRAERMLTENRKKMAAATTALAKANRALAGGGGGGRSRGGGGGGGGSARVTEAQKEQSQIQQIQQQSNQQMESAERAHQQRMLDIQVEFARRQAEALQQAELAKRTSRADFYDSLTQARDVAPDIQQGLSAAYEAAFAEAQKMAQEGNAQLANEYLKLKQAQINAELDYQKRVAAAREAGDSAEVERLAAIENLRKQARDEELKQLLAGGDKNVAERNAALAEEERKFGEQQDGIAAKAEQAAARKLAAAGKALPAINAENAALTQQAGLYDRIAARQGSVIPVSPAPVAPVPAPAAGTTLVNAPDVVSAVSGAATAIGRLEGRIDAVERAVSGVERAVRSIRLTIPAGVS